MKKKPIVLAILDGYGYNENSFGNAIYSAKTPNLDRCFSTYPTTYLDASGMAVGLPKGQMGNSEVGHTNIGAGRTVYQELTRITKSIDDGDFYKNQTLIAAMDKVNKGNTLHIMGLLSNGGVHSHIDHIMALVKMAAERGVANIKLHCFLDGRDTAPDAGAHFIQVLGEQIARYPNASIATVVGRLYAMDRDNRWDRVRLAYDAIVFGKGKFSTNFIKDVENLYKQKISDEFIMPMVAETYKGAIDGDSFIFANFRPDRARQISRALADPEFTEFDTEGRPKLSLTSMTMYDVTMKFVSVAFAPQKLENTLGQLISKNGLTQLRIAETEKYAHVTFFFNGGVEKPYEGEDRILVPSPKVLTYDLAPEMSAYEVTDKLIGALAQKPYDLVILNLANCDMVGHTGNFDAAVKAVEAVDNCVGRICEAVLEMGGAVILTADHGNADNMINDQGSMITTHSLSPVPFCIVGSLAPLADHGILADVAPTIIELIGLEKPVEMTGRSILKP